MPMRSYESSASVELGLRQNASQFFLLILINAFVGGMVGLERTILPRLAEEAFAVKATTALLSFIVVFGISKAIANYLMGSLANRFGRKKLLLFGWLIGLPVPFLLLYAPNWGWVVFANLLLGINQGFAWSSTVIMKIDLVGERDRGLAMGLNEFAGYISVALFAFLTGYLASTYGVRPYPFYLGIGLAVGGFLLSLLFVQDTHQHVSSEAVNSSIKRLENIFTETSWRNAKLGSVTQAGLVNNLNDGMMWGLLPILLANKGFSLKEIGIIAGTYPAVWGVGQIFTGKLSDHYSKRWLLTIGMLLQGLVLLLFVWASTFSQYIILAALLGGGTALVYPTFLAAIADYTHPLDRAKSLGIFRFWRDMGYAVGAILTGLIADLFGIDWPVVLIGLLTLLSGAIIYIRMIEKH